MVDKLKKHEKIVFSKEGKETVFTYDENANQIKNDVFNLLAERTMKVFETTDEIRFTIL